jgi:hypothetical protein
MSDGHKIRKIYESVTKQLTYGRGVHYNELNKKEIFISAALYMLQQTNDITEEEVEQLKEIFHIKYGVFKDSVSLP